MGRTGGFQCHYDNQSIDEDDYLEELGLQGYLAGLESSDPVGT